SPTERHATDRSALATAQSRASRSHAPRVRHEAVHPADDGTMLVDVIGDLLPSAVAVALSPVPIIAITLVLDSPNARTRGLAFALGWVTGLLVVSSTVLVIADGGDPDAQPSVVVSWIKVAVGVLFFALAVRQWRGRAKDGT